MAAFHRHTTGARVPGLAKIELRGTLRGCEFHFRRTIRNKTGRPTRARARREDPEDRGCLLVGVTRKDRSTDVQGRAVRSRGGAGAGRGKAGWKGYEITGVNETIPESRACSCRCRVPTDQPTQPDPTARSGLLFLFAVRFIFALISPFSSRRLLMGDIPSRGGGGRRHKRDDGRDSGWNRRSHWLYQFALSRRAAALAKILLLGEAAILPSMTIKLIILFASHRFSPVTVAVHARGSSIVINSHF